MTSSTILDIYQSCSNNPNPRLIPIPKPSLSARPNSISIEDAFFGDSGKGSVVAKLNHILSKKGPVISLRYNGGANAGHETYFHGRSIVTHQLPTGVIEEGAMAIISRGMVIHPEDLLTEITEVGKNFGSNLPGRLMIDPHTVLCLDTHRAEEAALKKLSEGGKGSTNRGIASAYASVYLRNPVTLGNLLSKNWEDIFRSHYRLYQIKVQGFGLDLKNTTVYNMGDLKKEKVIGIEDEFINRLKYCHSKLKSYAYSDMYDYLQKSWNDPQIPFTIEGAQGIGLDPYHGVYPDVTSSRSASRNINDATYNIILPEEIFLRLAVMKTTYISSVGSRQLPAIPDPDQEKWIQKEFNETGRSTGRLRDIYPIPLPIAQYLKVGAGYQALVATHLDASKPEEIIRVATHYTDPITGAEKPYLPYQSQLDGLIPQFVEFKGWDGQAVKKAKTFEELPLVTKKYLSFLSKTIAPIAMLTTGPDLEEYISLLSNNL